MTACEVLSWIAFGEILELDERIDLGEAYRWGHTDLHETLAAIHAIIAGTWAAELPPDSWADRPHRGHPAWAQDGRAWIKALRQRIERHDAVAISLPKLGEMLAEHIEWRRRACARLDLAEYALLEALRRSAFKAYGRRIGGGEHQEIPATVFMDPRIEVTWFNTVESASPGPPRFTDMRFQTADVLRMWPAQQTEPITAPRLLTEPAWISLAEAKQLFITASYSETLAPHIVCARIAVSKIRCRVTIATSDASCPGKVLSSRHVEPPERLQPDELDWEQSRPHAPWRTLTYRKGSRGWMRCVARSVDLLELYKADVLGVIAETSPKEALLEWRQSLRLASVSRLKVRLARSPEWVNGNTLAEWWTRQAGAVPGEQRKQLYDEACRAIFGAGLAGEFIAGRRHPHFVQDASLARFLPEGVDFAQGTWWNGKRDHAGKPVLRASELRRYIAALWLPAVAAKEWLAMYRMEPPPWLTDAQPAPHLPFSLPTTTVERSAHVNCDLSSDELLVDRLQRWYAEWSAQNPQHSEAETKTAAEVKFPGDHITRQMIRNLRTPPDGNPRPRGRKPGKSDTEHDRRMRRP